MNARQKLNGAAVTGALVFGALLGWVTGSFLVFILTVVVILGAACHDGSLRGKSDAGGWHGHHGRRRR